MASTSIIYNLIARDNASKTFNKVGESSSRLEKGFGRLGTALKGAAVAVGAVDLIGVASVKMAADFQTQMTRVETGAGELKKNMDLVGSGVLKMAGQVGASTSQLTTGLYTVESAGFHGANALTVLKTAAQGAKVGAADLGTTTDAVTTALNAYGLGAGSVTKVMNAMIATEGAGKTTLEALAGSLSNVLPTAAAAKVGLNEVLGAMATMTSQGTPAAQAATYLRQVIGQLSNPSAKAANEMKTLGLNATQVGLELGNKGLAATLTTITDAIEKHMGPAGTVLINQLKSAANNTSAYQKVLANLSPTQQTYIGALATMVGGTKSMQAALELSGPHMKTFQKNVDDISAHVAKGGTKIEGWAEVQKTFNQRLAEAKDGLQAMAIKIGTAALPAMTKLVGGLSTSVIPAVSKFAGFLFSTAIPAVAHFGSALLNKFIPVHQISKDLSSVTTNVGGFLKGVSGKSAQVKVVAHHAPIELPQSTGAKLGSQVHDIFSSGISDGIKNIDWSSLGKTLAKGVVKALGALAKMGSQIASKLGDALGSIDWVSLGKSVGENALPFVIGFVNNLLNPLFSGSFWKKHWKDILLFAVTFIPVAKFLGLLGKVVEHIPFLKALAPMLKMFDKIADPMWQAIKKFVTKFGGKVVEGFVEIFPEASGAIGKFVSKVSYAIWSKAVDIADAADKMVGGAAKGIGRGIGNALKAVGRFISKIVSPFAKAGSWLLNKGADLVVGMLRGINTAAMKVDSWLGAKVITPIKGAFSKAGSWLLNTGGHLLSGLKNGIVDAMKGIGSWVKTYIVNPVVNAVKHFFGIHSPSTVFAELGGHLTGGLLKGMAEKGGANIAKLVFGDLPHALEHIVGKGLVKIGSLPGKAMKALGGLGSKLLGFLGIGGGSAKGGVGQWAGDVKEVLALLGAPSSALSAVLTRIGIESGGNPKAINLWDSNAKAGHPSQGLMQTIPSTFAHYAGPFRGRGIDDPLASIYAGINYAMHRYGKNWINVMTRPGGYAKGGKPKSGEVAWVGEQGPELVRFRGGETVYNHNTSMTIAKSGLRGFASGTSGSSREVAQTLANGWLKSLEADTAKGIASAVKSLNTKLQGAGAGSLVSGDNRIAGQMESLANQRASIASSISKAQAYATSESSSLTDFLSAGNSTATTSYGLISQMQAQQRTARQFAAETSSLAKRGLNKNLLSQLAQQGPGGALASVLANASNGDIAQLNKISASQAKLTTSFGNQMSDAMYDSGSQAGKGFLAGLKAQDKNLQTEMDKLASGMVKTIKHRLKIKSPSRVMRDEVGWQVGAGLVAGMDAHAPHVAAAAQRMADTASGGRLSRPVVAQVSGTQPDIHVHVNFRDEAMQFLAQFVDVRVEQGHQDLTKALAAGQGW